MGVYYKVVNLDKRQFICPKRVHRDHGIKHGPMIFGPIAKVVMAAIMNGMWKGDRIAALADEGGAPGLTCDDFYNLEQGHDEAGNLWTDVTEYVIASEAGLREKIDADLGGRREVSLNGVRHVHGCQCGDARCHNAAIEVKRNALEREKRCETPEHTTMILDCCPPRCQQCGRLYQEKTK